jgi:hypothetical protein
VGGREPRWQLIATRVPEALVLSGVDGFRLSEDLACDLLVVERLILVRARGQLRPVNGDHPDLHEPRLGADREHVAEDAGERVLVTLNEPRDRRVIRSLVHSDHAEGDVLQTLALYHARGPLTSGIAV